MSRTTVEGEQAVGPRARGYWRVPGLKRYGLAREAAGEGTIVGDGGVHSCLQDMRKWALGLQEGKLVGADTIAAFTRWTSPWG